MCELVEQLSLLRDMGDLGSLEIRFKISPFPLQIFHNSAACPSFWQISVLYNIIKGVEITMKS